MLATLEVFTIWCVVMGYVLIYFNVQFWFSAKTLRAFWHGGARGNLGRWSNLLRWPLKNNPPLHAILQPCHPGCTFSQLLNGHLARKEEKMLANHAFWQLMVSYTHLLPCSKLQWCGLLLLPLINYNAAKPRWILCEFDESQTQARLDGLPHLETLHGKIWTLLRGLPGLVDRSTHLDRSPYLSCQHDQIKLRDYNI